MADWKDRLQQGSVLVKAIETTMFWRARKAVTIGIKAKQAIEKGIS